MTVVIAYIIRVGDEVPAVYIVDVAVVIVVEAVARNLAGIDPQLASQVGVRGVQAAVYDGNDGGSRPGHDIPGRWGLDFAEAPLA